MTENHSWNSDMPSTDNVTSRYDRINWNWTCPPGINCFQTKTNRKWKIVILEKGSPQGKPTFVLALNLGAHSVIGTGRQNPSRALCP